MTEQEKFKERGVHDPLIATIFDDRYLIYDVGGHGATSTVYRAMDNEKNSLVALKIMHGHLASNDLLVERFKREAETAAILDHPNIASVYKHAVSKSGAPYIVMEFIDGVSLREALTKDGWLKVAKALAIFSQVCAAISIAHGKGVVHRDLKPENIILSTSPDGELLVKVLDFGCAQTAPMLGETVLRLTQTGEMLGSLLYMSPEQCLDQDVDERSDIYSLGCLMYETVTGTPPLSARTAFETMNKQLSDMPEPLSKIRPELKFPPGLEDVIFKAMAKLPNDRYSSASHLLEDLGHVAAGKAPLASSEGESKLQVGEQILGRTAHRSMPVLATRNDFLTVNYLLFMFMVSIVFISAGAAQIAYIVFALSFVGVLAYLIFRLLRERSRARPTENIAGQSSVRAHEETVLAIVDCDIEGAQRAVPAEIKKISAQDDGKFVLVLDLQTAGPKDDTFNKHFDVLLIKPDGRSELFWNSLLGGGQLPLAADLILDSKDCILAIICQRHLGHMVEATTSLKRKLTS